MHRIDGAGHVGNMFVTEDASIGRPPTEFTAEWFNAVQEELAAVAESAGFVLSKLDAKQVVRAIQSGNLTVATASGTADAITLTCTPTVTAFGKGPVWWRATAANTSTTPTIKRDGLAAKTLVKGGNQALAAGDVPGAGAWMCSIYDSVLDKEVLINPAKGVSASNGTFVGQTVMSTTPDAPPNTLPEDGAAYSRATYADLFAALVKISVVTISQASPGVVTWNNHGRKKNDPIKFTSSGILPAGLTTGVTYYVVGSSITTHTFHLSATPGGAAIATTTAGSGIHTAINAPYGDGDGSTTFNVPDTRGNTVRGWDANRGVNPERVPGSEELDQMQGHVHGNGLSILANDDGGGASASNAAVANTTGPISDGANGTPRVGAETRMRNIVKYFFIVYRV